MNTLENLVKNEINNTIKIEKFATEFAFVPYSGAVVRQYNIKSNFKHIYGVNLTPVATESTVISDGSMLQILHRFSSTEKIVRFTAKSNQTVLVMIIGILN